jgi:type I site-specific restriction endonuclease
MTPEACARQTIDALLTAAGWHVCDVASANLNAGSGAVKGVAIREFPLNPGHGFADYLLYVNGKACGVIEAKKEGATLSGVEGQSARYAQGLPGALPAWRRPFGYFDAHPICLTATSDKKAFGFFSQDLAMEYCHAQAEDVDVNGEGEGDVFRIKTEGREQVAFGTPQPKTLLPPRNANIPVVSNAACLCPG